MKLKCCHSCQAKEFVLFLFSSRRTSMASMFIFLILFCFNVPSICSFGIASNFTCSGCTTSSLSNNDAVIFNNNFYDFTFSPWVGPHPQITGTFTAVLDLSPSSNFTSKTIVFVDSSFSGNDSARCITHGDWIKSKKSTKINIKDKKFS